MSVAPDLLPKLLSLTVPERAEIAHRLILSLEEPDFDAESEALWAVELEARMASVREGHAAGTAWRDSIDRMRFELHREKTA
jgi:putative addiction module component (TIGR02574 family)